MTYTLQIDGQAPVEHQFIEAAIAAGGSNKFLIFYGEMLCVFCHPDYGLIYTDEYHRWYQDQQTALERVSGSATRHQTYRDNLAVQIAQLARSLQVVELAIEQSIANVEPAEDRLGLHYAAGQLAGDIKQLSRELAAKEAARQC